MTADLAAVWGVLLPEGTLHQPWFQALAVFVAINTLVYVTLAMVKSLPRIYPGDFLPRRHRRSETRSIYPDDPR